jgi:hypothetical protein
MRQYDSIVILSRRILNSGLRCHKRVTYNIDEWRGVFHSIVTVDFPMQYLRIATAAGNYTADW